MSFKIALKSKVLTHSFSKAIQEVMGETTSGFIQPTDMIQRELTKSWDRCPKKEHIREYSLSTMLVDIVRLYPGKESEVQGLWAKLMKCTYLKFYNNYSNVRSVNDKKEQNDHMRLYAGVVQTGNSVLSYK